jgi:hypothetical protein
MSSFNVITYTDLQFDLVESIFNTMLSAFYHQFSHEVKECIGSIVSMSLQVYDGIKNELRPTPKKFPLPV